MTVERESELRMALRHGQPGPGRILRQANVIAVLRNKSLLTDHAKAVANWLGEAQGGFEDHYRTLSPDGFAAIDNRPRAGCAGGASEDRTGLSGGR